MKISVLVVTLGGALVVPVKACDLCSLYTARQAHGEVGKGIFGGVAEQFTSYGTLQTDGVPETNPTGQYMDSSIMQVFAGYNFSDRFSLQVNVPWIHRTFRRPEGFNIEEGTVSGIGDVSALAVVVPVQQEWKNTSLSWSILGGIKFPTGSTSRLAEEITEVEVPGAPPNAVHGHDLTLGSGSYDEVVGTTVYGSWRRAFLGATLQYAIRSTGDYDYRFANDLTWSGGPGYYLVLNDNATFAVQFLASGEHKGLDTFQGAPADDTGIDSVYVGPQLIFTFRDKFSAELGADLPVSLRNTAFQIVPDYRLRAGFTWHL